MGIKQSNNFVNNIQLLQQEREPGWRYDKHELHLTPVKEWTYSLHILAWVWLSMIIVKLVVLREAYFTCQYKQMFYFTRNNFFYNANEKKKSI